MKDSYSQLELDELLSKVAVRRGWDFSRMNTLRRPVAWDYVEEVKKLLRPSDVVLDIGTGGGERFMELSPYFKSGIGVDVDPDMVATAKEKTRAGSNITFAVMDEKLGDLSQRFDMVINRHAPFDLPAVRDHLTPGGHFITQQVGEKNMENVKTVIGLPPSKPVISQDMLTASGLTCVDFREYNVEYVVQDIESLVFWLNALDMLHADIAGRNVLKSADTLNRILRNNVDDRGFVTNEHRYLAIATTSSL